MNNKYILIIFVCVFVVVEPGICNRRENRGEQGGGFFDEKSESVALLPYEDFATVELFSEEKAPHCSTNSASYCKFRVKCVADDMSAFIRCGATSLAIERIGAAGERVDIAAYHDLLGGEAMAYIRWGEPEKAIQILERNTNYIDDALREGVFSPNVLAPFAFRTRWDRFVALEQSRQMEKVIDEYEEYARIMSAAGQKDNAVLPPWAAASVAESYRYARRPEKAIAMYRNMALERSCPEYSAIKMAQIATLMESGCFDESGRLLEEFDCETPVLVVERGILRENWRKEEIARNRGWWLIYQGRLKDARLYLHNMLERAPFNTHTRTALAHAYLWSGWPRLALEEFRIANTLEPGSYTNATGYCYALEENGYGKQARSYAKSLLEKYPRERQVKDLNRYFTVQDKRTLEAGGGTAGENGSASAANSFVRLSQPLSAHRSIFAGMEWRDTSEGSVNSLVRRGTLGADILISRGWRVNASASADETGANAGLRSQISWTPGDYVSVDAMYDSHSVDMPLEALAEGIFTDEKRLRFVFRANEALSAGAAVSERRFSDCNVQQLFECTARRGLYADARWKLQGTVEADGMGNSLAGASYFNPGTIYSARVVPSAEYVWYRRFETVFTGNLSAGAGMQWQNGYDTEFVWHARLMQDMELFDVTGISAGAGFYHRRFDGRDDDRWEYTAEIKQRF